MPSAYYAAIFEQSSGPVWAARWGLSSVEFQRAFDQFVSQGYRPVNVSGYSTGYQTYYAAIFEQSSGPVWAVRWGLSSAEFQRTFDQFVSQGYRPVNVSGYSTGQAYYAAIFEQSNSPVWAARWGLSSAEFQRTFDQFVSQGYRLVNVSGYGIGQAYFYPYYAFGQAYYAAIFEQSNSPVWAVRWGLSSAEFQQTFDQFVSQGYRLLSVSGYGV